MKQASDDRSRNQQIQERCANDPVYRANGSGSNEEMLSKLTLDFETVANAWADSGAEPTALELLEARNPSQRRKDWVETMKRTVYSHAMTFAASLIEASFYRARGAGYVVKGSFVYQRDQGLKDQYATWLNSLTKDQLFDRISWAVGAHWGDLGEQNVEDFACRFSVI